MGRKLSPGNDGLAYCGKGREAAGKLVRRRLKVASHGTNMPTSSTATPDDFFKHRSMAERTGVDRSQAVENAWRRVKDEDEEENEGPTAHEQPSVPRQPCRPGHLAGIARQRRI
ncbi:hypothetical protein MPTK1_7g18490 [Marchantia polymorpha subsp. ruderalis]|uniref:Uncharacterized protein n=2 Tax=Marchantia polymorpha TaxID=3197 RepID=A0AAF6C145_MARPO|nr:hypothetical protein MARPO_0165s0009 [Marchantia polymorpha]BBN17979.1 hypothetical protein Mp_7g18490 [Marchantia polymorpha subsp. ruderalis]|eukprot:PTQ28379.1 hypothetical protein MARPO_0165s0009 [Marchantia polymorpha]